MPDYLPHADGDKIAWYNNYNTKIGADGPTVGLTAGDISGIQAKLGAYLSQFNTLVQLRNTLKAATATTRAQEKALLVDVRKQVARAKTHAGFTPAIGQNLDVIGEESAFDPDTFKPNLKVTVFPGAARAEFNKGETDGVNLYCRLRGQTGWKFIARDTNSPYEDHTALAQAGVPEEREYAARAVLNDAEIGLLSDIVSVTYAG